MVLMPATRAADLLFADEAVQRSRVVIERALHGSIAEQVCAKTELFFEALTDVFGKSRTFAGRGNRHDEIAALHDGR